MPTHRAAAVAPAARAWLAQNRSARVINVFDRAVNLVNDTDELLSIVTHERGMTPFGLALAHSRGHPFHEVSAASLVRLQPGEIVLGHTHILWAGAEVWHPQPHWDSLRAALASEPWRLDELAAMTAGGPHASPSPSAASPPPASMLELYRGDQVGTLPPALAVRLLTGASDFVAGLSEANQPRLLRGARQLAGAGGGLTPAGDDFVVGASLAAWAGRYGPAGPEMIVAATSVMAPLTTSLSAAYLRAAARGECAAPWHALFAALLVPAVAARRAALSDAVSGLLAVGHTSGADGLAGFLAYNQPVFRRTHENPA